MIQPSSRGAGRAYVDFIFGLDYLSVNSALLRLMREEMGALGLSCLLLNKHNVERAVAAVREGGLCPLVYLDLCSASESAFGTLLRAMAERGSRTLCDPRHLYWTYKSQSHPALEQAGFPLPPTVIIPAAQADRDLSPEERSRVGERCVIKPSFGVAGRGAVLDVAPDRDRIAAAREFDRRDDWLIQKMVRWTDLGDRQAYLRGYNVMGHRTLMWWNATQGYARLTWDDLRRYDLLPAVELVDRLAAITGMEFFSTEIAITARSGPDRFCLIDYVNDQCDIDPQAHPGRSPPEEWARWICHRLARFTQRKKYNMERSEEEGTLFLAD